MGESGGNHGTHDDGVCPCTGTFLLVLWAPSLTNLTGLICIHVYVFTCIYVCSIHIHIQHIIIYEFLIYLIWQNEGLKVKQVLCFNGDMNSNVLIFAVVSTA